MTDGEGDHDPEFVELRRYDDPLQADMARDFLEQSGVTVLMRGNSGVTGVLNRFDTILDIRLTVPASQLALAREALEAMQSPAQTEAPFRGIGHEKEIRHESSGEDADEPIPRKKSVFLAPAFALMLPIGAGHMYAGHAAAGQLFAIAIVTMSAAAIFGMTWLWLAAGILIAIDLVLAPVAAQRFNRDRIPSASRQRGWSLAAIFASLLAASMLGR